MPAFWGFTIAMIVGGPIVDYPGIKKGMWIAFVLHATGIVATLVATDLTSLFLAIVLMGFGNGMIDALKSLLSPLYLFVGVCMMMSAATELITTQRIESLLAATGSFVFVGAAIFALGVTLFWPRTLAFVSENLPQSGAFGLSIMGGLGTPSVSVILPIMGRVLNNAVGTEAIRTISILPGILIVLYGGLFFLAAQKLKQRHPYRISAPRIKARLPAFHALPSKCECSDRSPSASPRPVLARRSGRGHSCALPSTTQHSYAAPEPARAAQRHCHRDHCDKDEILSSRAAPVCL